MFQIKSKLSYNLTPTFELLDRDGLALDRERDRDLLSPVQFKKKENNNDRLRKFICAFALAHG